MGNHPRKHIGILSQGKVWNYSNTNNKVVADLLPAFQSKFTNAYKSAGATVELFLRRELLLALFLYGCSTDAQNHPEPTGEEIFQALLKNESLPLSEEPLCDVLSVSMDLKALTLGDHLATVLSTSYNTGTTNTIAATCEQSKHDQANNTAIDIWDCTLQVAETSANGDYISGSTIAFGITLEDKELIKGSLRCF